MCGIVGLIDTRLTSDQWVNCIRLMNDSMAHRGPDDEGHWYDSDSGVGLGNRRLAVVDLSPMGHQPMASASGRYMLTFNGEVYNFIELRSELERKGHTFRSQSDTEVMLAAFEQWGVEDSVKRFVGMFALALWDVHKHRLHLIRDRLGIKPLYYGLLGKTFGFSSELKALCAVPEFKPEVDQNVLSILLRLGYIPAPYSIYQGIHKLPPGAILTLNPETIGSFPSPKSYWSARDVAVGGQANPFAGTADDAVDHLDTQLRHAVELRMVSDVPIGAFLSGGIDSSSIVAIMQALSTRSVRTFSIGFTEEDYNEASHAKAVANHLGTEHTELYVTPEQAIAAIPKLPTIYDEPFSDSSQIPTLLVSELAREQVTVCLSGDGGDELFGGYDRYSRAQNIWQKIHWMPNSLRGITAGIVNLQSPQRWDGMLDMLSPIIPNNIKDQLSGDRLHKLADVLTVEHEEAMYRRFQTYWNPTSLLSEAMEPPTVFTDREQWANLSDLTQRMMYLDTVSYLPDDILVKLDRASMAVSLESRVPLLDHRIVEFAWSLPTALKVRNGRSKWLLRKVLDRYVPSTLIDRRKMGFAVPIGIWLRGPLRDWAESLLDESRLSQEGYFDPKPIRAKWAEHLASTHDWKSHLWNILMFQAWKERWL